MNVDYQILLKPLKINKMIVKNRIGMAPMSTAADLWKIDDKQIDYYEARAKGGAGLIIIEGEPVDLIDPAFASATHTGTDEQLRQWENLLIRLKGYGCKVCLQLSAGLGRNNNVGNAADVDIISSSAIPAVWYPDRLCRPMTIEEIQTSVKDFGKMAGRAKMAGFDAVEIHGHLGYLLDQFLSECWNKRTDEYGGSLENRTRYAVEIIDAVRQATGPDFPILFRFSVEHKFPGGRKIEEGLEILKILDKAGVDAFDLNDGSHETFEWVFPPTYYGDACCATTAERVKLVTSKPILNAGNHTPETAVNYISENKIDMVMLGRGYIAEPEFAKKIAENRRDEIRPCIRCNEGCIGRSFAGFNHTCAVNMQAFNEGALAMRKTDAPKKVVVIGGGPGGMEAARVAALKGHRVYLYEKSGILGGQANASATLPFKTQLRAYLDYLIHQMDIQENIELHLHEEITAESDALKDADEIIVAIGASPIVPRIEGIDGDNVIEVSDAHCSRHNEVGNRVVIAGGGMSGTECGLGLAMEGKDVTIVEMAGELAANTLSFNKPALFGTMRKYSNLKSLTSHRVLKFNKDSVEVMGPDGEAKILPCDTAITAFGTRSRTDYAEAILMAYPQAKIVGDCKSVGQVIDAVRLAYLSAWAIE